MITATETPVAKFQWVAIFVQVKVSGLQENYLARLTMIQICGLFTSQYQFEATASSSTTIQSYTVLLLQMALVAISGVYNHALLANDRDASLNAQNTILFGCGTTINLVVHFVLSFVNQNEAGFLARRGRFSEIMAIASIALVGLASTAVYKCMSTIFLLPCSC
jgi:hypothetical protein